MMTKEFYRIAAVISAFFLSACASTHPAPDQAEVEIKYYGPNNDLNPLANHFVGRTYIQPSSELPTVLNQRPMHAIVCNDAHTECKHAITLDTMRIKITTLEDGQLKLKGSIESQIGRRVRLDTPTGSFEDTIPNGIQILDEGTITSPFDRTVKLGDTFMLSGAQGSHFEFSINPATHIFTPK